MQKYSKLPKSITEQIQTLRDRGLTITDEQEARQTLSVVTYFRLASYFTPLESDKTTHQFKPEATFSQALMIYRFDKQLRDLLFSAIQTIEIALRTRVVQQASSRYGAFWFADPTLFTDRNIFDKCLASLNEELRRSHEDFLTEHFARYADPFPPAWKTLEVSSFGTLSKLFCNLSDVKLKKSIARQFDLPQHICLESWIKSLTVLRNSIAHHSRIWNRKFTWKPQLPATQKSPWILRRADREHLYAQLCCIQYLLNNIHSGNSFSTSLKTLLSKYPRIDYSAMGFPEGWEKEPLWK